MRKKTKRDRGRMNLVVKIQIITNVIINDYVEKTKY